MGGAAPTPALKLMDIDFSAAPATAAPELPQPLREFPALPQAAARNRVVMSESMPEHMMAQDGHAAMVQSQATAFLLNGKTFDMQRVDLHSWVGAWKDWEVVNDSDMDHPFHVHGT